MSSFHQATLLDGKQLAKRIRQSLKDEIETLEKKTEHSPGLAMIQVGERTDSATYLRLKKKACLEVGIRTSSFLFPSETNEVDVLDVIHQLNRDDQVHGILLQLPLPNHWNENELIRAIDPRKDVDGLHPMNLGELYQMQTKKALRHGRFPLPCTPKGCLRLLDEYHIPIEGKKAVIVGRSKIVGLPVALLLLSRNATVTVCHTRTANLKEEISQAEILIVAAGSAHLVKGEWLNPKAVVIDVGMNSIDDPSCKRGYKLVGDVQTEEARTVVEAITPVPGGVGPMTIAMLLENTLQSMKRFEEDKTKELPLS